MISATRDEHLPVSTDRGPILELDSNNLTPDLRPEIEPERDAGDGRVPEVNTTDSFGG